MPIKPHPIYEHILRCSSPAPFLKEINQAHRIPVENQFEKG
jgi:hypothetical protein